MDRDIILKVKEGDRKAFEELYNRYYSYALRTATAITKSTQEAADAVQETFIRVYRNIYSFNTNRPFKPWFYRILVNECNRVMKDKSRVVFVSHYMEQDSIHARKDDYHFEEYEELYAAIEALSDIYRIPIILKYLNDFTEKEIGEILSLNINTVKTRLYRGRQKLKKSLEKIEERRIEHG